MNINFKNGNENELYTLKEIKEDFAKIITITPTETVTILNILDKINESEKLESIKNLVPKDKEIKFNRFIALYIATTLIIQKYYLHNYKPKKNTFTEEPNVFDNKKLIENILNILTDEEFISKTLEMLEMSE